MSNNGVPANALTGHNQTSPLPKIRAYFLPYSLERVNQGDFTREELGRNFHSSVICTHG